MQSLISFQHAGCVNWPGLRDDPDAIRALQYVVDFQDELAEAIEPSEGREVQIVIPRLRKRKESLVTSMLAVAVAEQRVMHEVAKKEVGDVKTQECQFRERSGTLC